MPMEKLSLAQFDPVVNSIDENTEKIIEISKHAKKMGSKTVVFPELSLNGGYLKEDHLTPNLFNQLEEAIREIKGLSVQLDMDIVISYPRENKGKRFISLEYISAGKTLGIHDKLYLANYGHLEEHKYFQAGQKLEVIETAIGKTGLLICEDAWHPTTSAILAQLGAEIIIVSSATSVLDSQQIPEMKNAWETVTASTGFTQTCYVAYCNRIGRDNGVIFWGGSHVVGPDGLLIKRLPEEEEGLLTVDINPKKVQEVRERTPLVANEKLELNSKYYNKMTGRDN